MSNNYKLRLVSLALSIMMLGSVMAPALTATADESIPVIDSVTQQVNSSYNDYITDKKDFTQAESDIKLTADKAVFDNDINTETYKIKPTRNGYDFAGWYYDKNFTSKLPQSGGKYYIQYSKLKTSSGSKGWSFSDQSIIQQVSSDLIGGDESTSESS